MKKEGGRGAQDTGAESLPLQLVMKIMVRQVHGGPRWSRYPPVAHGRDPTPEQVNSWSSLWPRGSLHWSRLLPGPADPWREEPTLEQVCWQDFWPRGGPTLEKPVLGGLHPVEGTHVGAVHEELQPVGRAHVGGVCGELCPVGRTPYWSRGRVWGGRRGRENVWWTDCNLHSLSPCAAQGEEVENLGVKSSLGRREGWREGVLRFSFYFSLSYSDLIGKKLN